MNIELHEITIQELTRGFLNSAEQGVVAYGGLLDIRPAYQRLSADICTRNRGDSRCLQSGAR